MIWLNAFRRDSASIGAIAVAASKPRHRRREAVTPRIAPISPLAGLIRARVETRHGRAPTPAQNNRTQPRDKRRQTRTREAPARWAHDSRDAEVIARA